MSAVRTNTRVGHDMAISLEALIKRDGSIKTAPSHYKLNDEQLKYVERYVDNSYQTVRLKNGESVRTRDYIDNFNFYKAKFVTGRVNVHEQMRGKWAMVHESNFLHGLRNIKTLKSLGLNIGYIEVYFQSQTNTQRLFVYDLNDEVLIDVELTTSKADACQFGWLLQDVTRLLKRMCFDILSKKFGKKHINHLKEIISIYRGNGRNYQTVIYTLGKEKYPTAPEYVVEKYPAIERLEKLLADRSDSIDLLELPKGTDMHEDFELYRVVGKWLNMANNQTIFNNGKLAVAMGNTELGDTHLNMVTALDHYLRRNPKGLWATYKGTGVSFVKLTTLFLKSSFSTPAAANAAWLNVMRAFDLLRLKQIMIVDNQTAGKELAELLAISNDTMVSGIQEDSAPITQHRIRYLFKELIHPYLVAQQSK